MEPRMSGAIALRPSGNEQGGHYFLSLHTGKRILRNNWTILPMPNDVVEAVHRQAAASKQAGGITFTDRNGNIIADHNQEETEEVTENEPIPVADDNNKETIHNNDEEIIIEQQGDTQDNKITGVDENDQNAPTNNNYIQEHDLEDTQDNTQTIPEEESNESDEYLTMGM